jgi:P4 family phage/plasmid primase-like protien
MSILDAPVSLFPQASSTTVTEHVPLRDVLGRIQRGTYLEPVERVRTILATKGKPAYKQAKKHLLSFTPGCSLMTRAQDVPWSEKLISVSGIVHYDFDDVPDPEALKARLAENPYCVYAFVSPSSNGIKAGFAVSGVTDPDSYRHAWHTVLAYLKTAFPDGHITEDPHVKFLHSLCFLSYDTTIFMREDPEIFAVPPPVPKTPRPQPLVEPTTDDYAKVAGALAMIPNADVHYDDWLSIGMALHSTNQPWARALWDSWSSQSQKFTQREQDATWSRFHADGGITIATVFGKAKEAGWRLEPARLIVKPPAHVPLMGQEAQEQGTAPTEKPVPGPQDDGTGLPYGDAFNAWQLVQTHGQAMRYCSPWKSWLTWTGSHWQRDTTGMMVRWQRQTIKRLAGRAADLDDDEKVRALMAHIKSSLNTSKLDAAIKQAYSWEGISIDSEGLDADPWLLNVKNGTLNLRTGILRPHHQADMLTKCLAIPYDSHAPCPTWERFLWRIMGGSMTPNTPEMSAGELEARHTADVRAQELIDFLQRAIGYALTGSTREQCLFILHGITKTGKSTFLAILRALFGPYGQQADMSSFMHKDRQEVRNDLADLAGSRFVCALESQEGQRLAESLVKQLTGGADLIKARFLFQEHFTFKPQFKIFLGTNHKPIIKDTDAAIWERIRLVPFTVQIPKKERDKALDEKLQHELPGILAWAMRGCLEWQRPGDLCAPEAVVQATATYREESDAIGRFIEECCLVSKDVQVKAGVLYDAYKRWCEAGGEHPVTLTKFGTRLEEQGFRHEKKSGTVWRFGIGLSTD